jgi:hypothetical protein
LVFFAYPDVAATRWKQALRRLEGLEDWNDKTTNDLSHDPRKKNGLKYLYDYRIAEASEIMTSPNYTRAIFLQDPKDRFLSVFESVRKKNPKNNQVAKACCPNTTALGGCGNQSHSMLEFLNLIQNDCSHPRWDPQYYRMEEKYWQHVNFVGRLDHIQEDAKRLLERIGAWDEVGKTGWGPRWEGKHICVW